MTGLNHVSEDAQARILDAARALFLEVGIGGAEMKMIAERAGVSRSTLYRYAQDKNQLVFRISSLLLTEAAEQSLAVPMQGEESGMEKLRQYARRLTEIYASNVPMLNFLGEFDRLFSGAYPDIPEAKEYEETMRRQLHRQAQFLFEGMADGSIRPLEKPMLFISVLGNTILGLSMRLLARDSHYIREHQASGREILEEAIAILLHSIENEPGR